MPDLNFTKIAGGNINSGTNLPPAKIGTTGGDHLRGLKTAEVGLDNPLHKVVIDVPAVLDLDKKSQKLPAGTVIDFSNKRFTLPDKTTINFPERVTDPDGYSRIPGELTGDFNGDGKSDYISLNSITRSAEDHNTEVYGRRAAANRPPEAKEVTRFTQSSIQLFEAQRALNIAKREQTLAIAALAANPSQENIDRVQRAQDEVTRVTQNLKTVQDVYEKDSKAFQEYQRNAAKRSIERFSKDPYQ